MKICKLQTHDDTSVRLKLPSHLGIQTIDGNIKTGIILVDDSMAHIIKVLWYKYNIGTIGSCKGHVSESKKISNLPWIQIGSGLNYPKWIIRLMLKETIKALDIESEFPIMVYDPRCIPINNPKVYTSQMNYDYLIKHKYEFDMPLEIIK